MSKIVPEFDFLPALQDYSELALEYLQKVKSKNYFAQVSNLTTKFLSVNLISYETEVIL